MQRTKIDWVINPDGTRGYTFNPIKGMCPVGCPYCYARRFYQRFGWPQTPTWNQTEVDRADDILASSPKRLGVFVCSTFDWLWKIRWATDILEFCYAHPRHIFFLLTKLYNELENFDSFPDNCIVGITATNYQQMIHGLGSLGKVKASCKFVSNEPMLEALAPLPSTLTVNGVKWIIAGARTQPLILPKAEWVKDLGLSVAMAGAQFFMKDSLKGLGLPMMREWPEAVLQGKYRSH